MHDIVLYMTMRSVGLQSMRLGLAHSMGRHKLKFSPDKVDTMIVQVTKHE